MHVEVEAAARGVGEAECGGADVLDADDAGPEVVQERE